MTSVLSPSAIAPHAWAWAGVGAAKVPLNHSRVAPLKRLRGSVDGFLRVTHPSCQLPPTTCAERPCVLPLGGWSEARVDSNGQLRVFPRRVRRVFLVWAGPAVVQFGHFAPGTDRDEIVWIGSRGRRADHGGNDDRDSYDK